MSNPEAQRSGSGRPMLARTSAPQYHERLSTRSLMWSVIAALLPAAIWGVYVYGLRALLVVLMAIIASAVTETLISGSRETLSDGSAILTGLLLGMMLPPAVPWYVVIVAAVFAIGVAKWTFGGLGRNWINPALAGRVFVHFSWTGPMTRWTMPRTLGADSIAGATPLSIVQNAVHEGQALLGGPVAILSASGFPRSTLDSAVTEWLNLNVLTHIGVHLPAGYVDPFVGNVPGAIGEGSALLLLVGTLLLFSRRTISWEIPTAYFAAFAGLAWVVGGLPYGGAAFSGDVLFQLVSGSVIMVMFYVATDPVTSPLTAAGMLVFGAGAGALTFVIRAYGGAAEGAALAVLFMNAGTPLINRLTRPRRLGGRRGRRA